MAPPSQTNPEPRTQAAQAGAEPREILEAQLRECFGRVVYSHKTHEKCADILLAKLGQIKVAQIILSALTTAGFVGAIFGSGRLGALAGVIVSTGLLVLNAYTKNYDLGELAQKHKQAANDLWLIREKYLSLLTDLRSRRHALEKVYSARDALEEQLHSVYSGAPSTTHQAYRKAQEALKKYEDMTFSDCEIDAFLPAALKKSISNSKPAFGNLETGEVMLAPCAGATERVVYECPEGCVPGIIGPASDGNPQFHPLDHTQKPRSGEWIVPPA